MALSYCTLLYDTTIITEYTTIQKSIGWQWHQSNTMQIICTLIQTDNHASTSHSSIENY